jgi:16S rRNA (cytosine967-C5)-methyltransferase
VPDLDRIADRKLASAVLEGGRLRALLLELWQRTRMDWGFVTDRLATTFRKETWIGAHDRRFVSETLYGLVRHLRRVDLAIARGRKAAKPPRDLERLIALLVLDGLIEPARAAKAEPDLDWRAIATVDEAIAGERKLATRIALAASLPDWLAARFVADWGDGAEPLALALNQRAPMTVRANLLVEDRAALIAELGRDGLATHAGKWSDTALIVDSRTNLFGLAAFKRGALEAQDEGSQLLADLVSHSTASQKPIVVDYCAGAGGKTLAIAARLANHGRIFATDIDGSKLEELRRRARRATVSNAQAIAIDGGHWPSEIEALRGKADVVFVDAPCSGIGALRRNPEARWRMREPDLDGFATRQLQIIAAAKDLCAPGGSLIYATCTLLRVENQDVIAAALASHPELAAVPLTDVMDPGQARAIGDGESLIVTPHQHGTDGFYARILRRHQ